MAATPSQPLVVRAAEKPGDRFAAGGLAASGEQGRVQRMFEVDSNHGAIHGAVLTEFLFSKTQIAEVTCAPPHQLLAMYPAPLGDSPVGANGQVPTQLVVASAPR